MELSKQALVGQQVSGKNDEAPASSTTSRREKKHVAQSRSISSQFSSFSNSLLAGPAPSLAPSKKTAMTNFKVEAEIVNTDSSKSISLFDYTESSQNSNSTNPFSDTTADQNHHHSEETVISSVDPNINSDSEETFVYDTQQMVDASNTNNNNSNNTDDTMYMSESGDRPILVHKNSIRSSFKLNNSTNLQPRAFSQTVLLDNESISSKKFMTQRRIPTLQQPIPGQPGGSFTQLAPQLQRFPSRNLQYQPSISSKALLRSNNDLLSRRSFYTQKSTLAKANSGDSDEESFVSGDFARSETEGEEVDEESADGGNGDQDRQDDDDDNDFDDSRDDTNTTLKQVKSSYSSPAKSVNNNDQKSNFNSPSKHKQTRNLIVSQVRNVSKNLFENEKNYLKKKLSFGSLKEDEDEEASLILRSHRDNGSDDEFSFDYISQNHNENIHTNSNSNNNNNNNNMFTVNNNNSGDDEFTELWVSNYNRRQFNRYKDGSENNFYHYPSYDSVNPHNYVSKYKRKNSLLKLGSFLLRWMVFIFFLVTLGQIFIIKFISNPILDFQVSNIEKLIITENLLIFDVDCVTTNINLQNVIVDRGDIDVFITYMTEDNIEKTLLLGNISKFFVPMTFNGLLTNEQITFKKIFDSKYARSLTQTSIGQLKLSGDFKEIDPKIEWIINKNFELNLRGSFKYSLPFSSSLNLINVSQKYTHKEA